MRTCVHPSGNAARAAQVPWARNTNAADRSNDGGTRGAAYGSCVLPGQASCILRTGAWSSGLHGETAPERAQGSLAVDLNAHLAAVQTAVDQARRAQDALTLFVDAYQTDC